MKRGSIIFCIILLAMSASSFTLTPKEQSKLDSLNAVLANSASHDTSTSNAYVLLSEILYSHTKDTIIYLCEQARKIANMGLNKSPSADVKERLERVVAAALNNIAFGYQERGEMTLALAFYNECLSMSERLGDKQVMMSAYINIGLVHDGQGDYAQSIECYGKCLAIAKEEGNVKEIANSINNMGLTNYRMGNSSEALRYFQKSYDIEDSIGNVRGMARGCGNLAGAYILQGDMVSALERMIKAMDLYKEVNDERGIANTLNSIGYMHTSQGDVDIGLNYYKRSMEMRKKLGDRAGEASMNNNIGINYSKKNMEKEALKYFYRGLAIYAEMGGRRGMATSYGNIGSSMRKMGNLDDARKYHELSLGLHEEIGNKRGVGGQTVHLANLLIQSGELVEGRKLVERAMELAYEVGDPIQISSSAKVLSDLAKKEGNYMEAIEMKELYILMRDSVRNKETAKATTALKAKLDYQQQKALSDIAHDKEIEIQERERKHQKRLTMIASGGVLLVLVFLFFVFQRLTISRRQNRIIESQKQEVERQHKQVIEHRDILAYQKRKADDAHNLLKQQHQEIQDSINYAKRIQEAVLPSIDSLNKYLRDGFVFYKPKDVVAGDFFWMEAVDDVVYFAAADCTGHGVPGAMVSVVCANALTKALMEEGVLETGKILDRTREIVIKQMGKSGDKVKDGMDISLCALNRANGRLQWSGANNSLWIIKNEAKELIETKGDKQPIGVYGHQMPFISHELIVEKGDTIYLSTDGFPDQFGGPKGKKFKYLPFKALLAKHTKLPMMEQRDKIAAFFDNWRGELEQIDDVCVIGVKV